MIKINEDAIPLNNSIYSEMKKSFLKKEDKYSQFLSDMTAQLYKKFGKKNIEPFLNIGYEFEKQFTQFELFPNGMRQNEWHEICGWSLSLLDLLHIELRLISEVTGNNRTSEFILDLCMTIQNIMISFASEKYLTLLFEIRKFIEGLAMLFYFEQNDEKELNNEIPFNTKLSETVKSFDINLFKYYSKISNLLHFTDAGYFPGICINEIYTKNFNPILWDRNEMIKDICDIFDLIWKKTDFVDEIINRNIHMKYFLTWKKVLITYRRNSSYGNDGLKDKPDFHTFSNGAIPLPNVQCAFYDFIADDSEKNKMIMEKEYGNYLTTGFTEEGKKYDVSALYDDDTKKILDLLIKLKTLELVDLNINVCYVCTVVEEILMSEVTLNYQNLMLYYFLFKISEKLFNVKTNNGMPKNLIKYKHNVHIKRLAHIDFTPSESSNVFLMWKDGVHTIKKIKNETLTLLTAIYDNLKQGVKYE